MAAVAKGCSLFHPLTVPYLPLALSCLVFQSGPSAPLDFPSLPPAKGSVETESISLSYTKSFSVCK